MKFKTGKHLPDILLKLALLLQLKSAKYDTGSKLNFQRTNKTLWKLKILKGIFLSLLNPQMSSYAFAYLALCLHPDNLQG